MGDGMGGGNEQKGFHKRGIHDQDDFDALR